MEIFPNWTTIPVVFFLILLTFVLNRLFFIPLGKVLAERDRRITGAKKEAEEIRKLSQEKALAFDQRLRDARREADLEVAKVKTAALGEKGTLIAFRRQSSETMISEARADIRKKTDEALKILEGQTQSIGEQIASHILKRPIQGKGNARS
jgi:F-type H+-transporting ATPase subunit b